MHTDYEAISIVMHTLSFDIRADVFRAHTHSQYVSSDFSCERKRVRLCARSLCCASFRFTYFLSLFCWFVLLVPSSYQCETHYSNWMQLAILRLILTSSFAPNPLCLGNASKWSFCFFLLSVTASSPVYYYIVARACARALSLSKKTLCSFIVCAWCRIAERMV